jgi:3-oxoacyl-[acyl-carrier-protein] synthase II
MRHALERSELRAADVDYLNAHATGTSVGDTGELKAICSVFGRDSGLSISSTKGATGHTFGAAGAIEAIYSVQAIRSGMCPPTMNLDEPEEAFAALNLVRGHPQERPIKVALSNSFGFGSTKVALVFARI